MHLNAEINWHLEFEKLIKGFNKRMIMNKKITTVSSKSL